MLKEVITDAAIVAGGIGLAAGNFLIDVKPNTPASVSNTPTRSSFELTRNEAKHINDVLRFAVLWTGSTVVALGSARFLTLPGLRIL